MQLVTASVFIILFCQHLTVLNVQCIKDSPSLIDPSKTIIWGPGLNPETVVLRARYIFLQLQNLDRKNLTASPGDDVIKADIKGLLKSGEPCPIWTQILNCHDGSYIIRYNVQRTCFNFNLVIQVNNTVVVNISRIKDPIYEEECYCPNNDIKSWMAHNKCSQNYSQITLDLSPFRSVNFDNIRNSLIKEFHKPKAISFCHYVIRENKIYRQCYGQHVGFKMFMDSTLLSLTRKVVLPDIEFFMNLGDWPLVKKSMGAVYPMFSWCGSRDSWDIVLPTYFLAESSTEMMGRITMDMLSVQGNANVEWKDRKEKVFWRGRDSRRERLDLIDIARKYPDLINASITNFFFFRNEIDKYGPGEKHISFFKFFDYKYQLNIDGTVAAYRFPFLLAGNSLVFKQDSDYYEFFYDQLVSGEHYVPIKSNLADLVEKIRWAKRNDKTAYSISRKARQWTRDNLLPHNILCYHAVLFNEWSKRLKNKVKVLDGMENVPQPTKNCHCASNQMVDDSMKKKDEL